MRLACMVLLALGVVAGGACKKSESGQTLSQPAASGSPSNALLQPAASPSATNLADKSETKVDACGLLTSGEIQAVQGEPVRETKLSTRSDGGLAVSQCFFTLPTFTNSISLTFARRGEGAAARNPKDFWEETFGEGRDEKQKRKTEGENGEEEKESAPPQKITGLGDEAFWMPNRVGGALYVLKGNSYVRISVGGAGDQALKLQRARALAVKALTKM